MTPDELEIQPVPEGIGDAINGEDEPRKAEKRLDAKLEGDAFWRGVLGSEVGRREMWTVLHRNCRTFEVAFGVGPNGSPNPESTLVLIGRREIGLELYRSLLRIDHAAVHLMHKEHDPVFIEPKPKRGSKRDRGLT